MSKEQTTADKIVDLLETNLSPKFSGVVSFEVLGESERNHDISDQVHHPLHTFVVDAVERPIVVNPNLSGEAEITIKATFDTFSAVIKGETPALSALASNAVELKGSVAGGMQFLNALRK